MNLILIILQFRIIHSIFIKGNKQLIHTFHVDKKWFVLVRSFMCKVLHFITKYKCATIESRINNKLISLNEPLNQQDKKGPQCPLTIARCNSGKER